MKEKHQNQTNYNEDELKAGKAFYRWPLKWIRKYEEKMWLVKDRKENSPGNIIQVITKKWHIMIHLQHHKSHIAKVNCTCGRKKSKNLSGRMWCAKPRIWDMVLKAARSHFMTFYDEINVLKTSPLAALCRIHWKKKPTREKEMRSYCNNPGKKF